MEGEIEGAKTGLELMQEEQAKNALDKADNEMSAMTKRYLDTLPFNIKKQEVIENETEWFEIQVAKEKLLTMAKKALLDKGDYQAISGKMFIKKSGVRRLMSAFGISIIKVEITEWQRPWPTAPPEYIKSIGAPIEYGYRAQAWAVDKRTFSKNNQTASLTRQEMVGTGSFSSREQFEKKQPYKDHNISAMAETRAKSRAGLDILSGDVALEEM